MSDSYDGKKVITRVNGKKLFTPMIIVFVAIGVTDLLFAIDSIPAIFGITQSPFIVFTANLFALMGLRQLYFLLGDLLDRLKYLHYGIAFILAFIGVKLILHAMHVNELPFLNGGEPIEWAPEISTWVSLAVIILSMAVATVASLVAARREPSAEGPQDAAAEVADEKGTPATVESPSATDPRATDPRATRLRPVRPASPVAPSSHFSGACPTCGRSRARQPAISGTRVSAGRAASAVGNARWPVRSGSIGGVAGRSSHF